MIRRTLPPALLAALLLWAWLPFGRLDCGEGRWRSTGPDGATLTACARPLPFAMPGQGSDAPGWLVLRDARGFIRGVASLEMVQTLHGTDAEWVAGRVAVPLHAEFPAPAALAAPLAFLLALLWRSRAALGLVPADTSFR